MTSRAENLRIVRAVEEEACMRAQELIEKGSLIGKLIGRVERWVHEGELRYIDNELDAAALDEQRTEDLPPSLID